MAIDPTAYALTEWRAAIVAETTAGTINKTSMQLVNIDSPATITRSPYLFTGVRSGVGRTAKASDVYVSEQGQEKSISISGLFDKVVGKILVENCLGVAPVGNIVSLPYNYTNEVTLGATGIADNIHTLSFVNIVPEGDNSEYYAGCIVDELKITMDTASDGGRAKFDATLKTRGNREVAAAPTSPKAYGTIVPNIFSFGAAAAVVKIETLGGAADAILDSLELNFKANAQWGGLGNNGVGQVINRGMPEFEVTGIFGLKFDANTVAANTRYLAGTNIAITIRSDGTGMSDCTYGFKGDYGVITGDVNPEDVRSGAYVKVPVKFMASTASNIFEVKI